MANVLGELFQDIADAIRSKTGSTDTLKPNQFPEAIEGITTGGGEGEKPFDCHSVTFVYNDKSYVRSVADGDTCADPVERGLIPTPTKESTVQYNYTFYGWGASDGGAADANILKNITEDKTVYAIFTATLQMYTITWLDSDGVTELPGRKQWAYGSMPSYTPVKAGYNFIGWNPAVTYVTGNATYTAQWEEDGVVVEEISDDWDAIIAAAADGSYATKYKVGNYKPLEINGNIHNMQIVAKDTDILADGSGFAPLTFVSMNAKILVFNPRDYETWENSALRTQNIPEGVTQYIPENVMSAIKEVKKYSNGVNASGYATKTETTEKVWIPSMREMFGTHETNGVQYSAYITGELSRVKALSGISAIPGYGTAYWLRTSTAKTRYLINANGNSDVSSDVSKYVAPSFCL